MTVKKLIELNQHIVDIEIEIRREGRLVDVLEMGPARGRIPRCPRKVPESEAFIKNSSRQKMANYIEKSINSWDDGRDYWQVKPERIPKAWQNLEVYSWHVSPATYVGVYRRACPSGHGMNVNFHGEQINIIALPSGESMAIEKPKHEKEPDGQMSIEDFLEGTG